MKKLIPIASEKLAAAFLTISTIGFAMAVSFDAAEAQSKSKPQEKSKYQRRVKPETVWKTKIDPLAAELINQVVTSYSELKGLSFSVKGATTAGKNKIESNKVRFAYSRPYGLYAVIEPRPGFANDKQYDYVWSRKSKNFFIISRADDFIFDLDNLENIRKVKNVRYIKSRMDEIPNSYLSYVFSFSGFGQIGPIMALLEKRNVIVTPDVAGGMHIEQQIERLPDTSIGDELMQGVRIRRSSFYGKFPPVGKGRWLEETYWFGATDHLLRRYQVRFIDNPQEDMFSQFSLYDIKVNPAFLASEFQFVPPSGAIQIDENNNPVARN